MAKTSTKVARNSSVRPGTGSVDLASELPKSDYLYEAGNTGLKAFGGYVTEEYDPNLRGIRGARMFREMSDSSPTIGAFLHVINMVVTKLGWHLKPKDQTPMSLLAQEYFESLMTDMEHGWTSFIQEALSMIIYGYAPFEIVLKERNGEKPSNPDLGSKYDDGMIGIRKLGLRSQETVLRWIFDQDNNKVLGMAQIPWTGGIRMIPRSKMLLFRTRYFRNNPEGRSMLRNAYRPYYFSKRVEEIEGIGIERDLAGFPVIKIPAEVIAAAKGSDSAPPDPEALATLQAYQAMGKNIRRNSQECAIMPSDCDEHGNALFELTLLSAAGQRQFDTDRTIQRYQQQMASCVMADFLLLGHGQGKSGGSTLSSDKITMFFEAIAGLVNLVVEVLNLELVPLLGRLNGIPIENLPEFFTDKPEQVDLGRMGAYINALSASGMVLFPNEELEDFLLNLAGLPAPTPETREEQKAMQTSGDETGMPGQGGAAGPGGMDVPGMGPKPPPDPMMGHNGGPPLDGKPGAGKDPRAGAQGSFGQKPQQLFGGGKKEPVDEGL